MKPSEKSKNTNELMQILSSAKTPEELQAYTETLKQEHISCSFADFISEKLRERELSAADLIRNSMIQRNYGYQLLNGTRTPSRDKVLAFCLALGLDLTDTELQKVCIRPAVSMGWTRPLRWPNPISAVCALPIWSILMPCGDTGEIRSDTERKSRGLTKSSENLCHCLKKRIC